MIKRRISQLGFLLLLSIMAVSCVPRQQPLGASKSQKNILPERIYYVDINGNGTLDRTVLEDKPVPVQGEKQWMRDYGLAVSYPSTARKNGIEGLVILVVLIDEFGKIKKVKVKESVSKECGVEAKRAFLLSSQKGFSPAKYNGKAVECIIDWSFGFWLG